MRVVECPCGLQLKGQDDEDLFWPAREHVDRDHPEMERTDDQIKEIIASGACDA
jgi:predicted small metal-binding protein